MASERELLVQLRQQARERYGPDRAAELSESLVATAEALAVIWQTPLELLEDEPDRLGLDQ